MAVSTFTDAKDALLLRFYLIAMKDIKDGWLWASDVPDLRPTGVSVSICRKALEALKNEGFLDSDYVSDQDDLSCEISAKGLMHIDDQLSNAFGYAYANFVDEERWADEFLSKQSELPSGTGARSETPTSGMTLESGFTVERGNIEEESNNTEHDPWQPLPLDRENPALEEAVAKIEELVEAVGQDNGYAANEPDERAFILSALNNGAKTLRDQTVIYRMQFEAFIWEPLNKLVTRFHKAAIGVLAEAARELIKEALKHAAKSWWS